MIPPAPPTGSGKALRRIAVALPMVAILGYVVFWFAAEKAAQAQVDAWIALQRSRGIEAQTGEVTSTGFPFAITLRLATPSAKAPSWSWRGPALEITGKPWSLARLTFRAPGTHALALAGKDGAARQQKILAGSLDGAAYLEKGRLARLDIRLADLDATGDLGAVKAAALHLDIPVPAGTPEKPVQALMLDVATLSFPATPGLIFGDTFDRVTLDLVLEGPVGTGRWPEPALAWRDAGGVLQARGVGITYGPLNLTGEGTAAIDRLGQPEGAFTARITGFAEAIQALRKLGYMDPGAANAAQVVLGLLARGQGNGGRTLAVPLTLQDRTLSLGPVQLFRLKPVDWFKKPAE